MHLVSATTLVQNCLVVTHQHPMDFVIVDDLVQGVSEVGDGPNRWFVDGIRDLH